MGDFKLDRTAFRAQTRNEAANHARIYKKLSWQQRLKIAAYLNSVAYNFDFNNIINIIEDSNKDKEITKKGARCFADNFGGVKYFIKYAESYPKKFKLYELTD